jgi:hypothetical protein
MAFIGNCGLQRLFYIKLWPFGGGSSDQFEFETSALKYHALLQGIYSVFQGFRQAKSANDGSILSSSQFLILPQLPQKNEACFKSGQS